jgi:hypothetical protein
MRPVSGSFGDRRPEVRYPCTWSYKLIGRDEVGMRRAIADVVGDSPHRVSRSNTSRTGRYCSVLLEVDVRDEEQRLRVFEALHRHPAVRFVL